MARPPSRRWTRRWPPWSRWRDPLRRRKPIRGQALRGRPSRGRRHPPSNRFRSGPGGKGLNVARSAHALGADVTATGILAGHAGRWIEEALAAEGVPPASPGWRARPGPLSPWPT
ncbi:MAG: PfkB family carbohydrate kinase [Actinomycetota bacterium]